ncbi:MAG: TolC family protein [Duncaniella sp.]|nr:TolC family protein [Duncaniella sp.]
MKRISSIVLSAAFVIQGASATDLNGIIDRVVALNPSDAISAMNDKAEILNQRADNRLDAPEVEFTRFWGTNSEVGNKWELSVTQSFDWPGVYAARRRAIAANEIALQRNREAAMRELRAEVRSLLVDIVNNHKNILLETQLAERMDSLEHRYRLASDAGDETVLDYNKTIIERIAIHRALHTLEAERATLMSSLTSLAGGAEAKELLKDFDYEYQEVDLATIPVEREAVAMLDPQVAALQLRIEALKATESVERRSLLPGFTVGYAHETELGGGFNGFTIGMTLPFLYGNKRIKSSKVEAEALRLEATTAVTKRVATINGDLKRLEALKVILDEYAPVVGTDSNIRLLKKALDARQITFLTYIEELNYFIAAQRDYLDTLYQYNQVLASLNYYN